MQESNGQPITQYPGRRTAAQWQTVVAAQQDSGLSQREYCEREGISLSSFSHWRRKLNGKRVAQAQFVELSGEARTDRDWQVELTLGERVVLRIRHN